MENGYIFFWNSCVDVHISCKWLESEYYSNDAIKHSLAPAALELFEGGPLEKVERSADRNVPFFNHFSDRKCQTNRTWRPLNRSPVRQGWKPLPLPDGSVASGGKRLHFELPPGVCWPSP